MVKMVPVQGLHGLQSGSNFGHILIQQQTSPSLMYNKKEGPGGAGAGGALMFSSLNSGQVMKSSHEQKSQEAANKHAIAERNRRKRINTHLNTLRKLFPHLTKRDKPRVLMETVKCIKELRKRVADRHGDEEVCCNGGNGASFLFLPGEKDELNVSYYEGEDHHDQGEGVKTLMVKAMICCEDRPRLNRELTEAVKLVKGKVVKAEMATIGGRTKAVLVVQWCKDGGGVVAAEEEVIGSFRRALKAVVDNRALGCSPFLGSHLGSSGSSSLGFEQPKGRT